MVMRLTCSKSRTGSHLGFHRAHGSSWSQFSKAPTVLGRDVTTDLCAGRIFLSIFQTRIVCRYVGKLEKQGCGTHVHGLLARTRPRCIEPDPERCDYPDPEAKRSLQ